MNQHRLEIIIEARNQARAAFNELIGGAGQLKNVIKALSVEAQTLRLKLAGALPDSADAIAYGRALQIVEQRMRLLQQVATDSSARVNAFASSMKSFGMTMSIGVTAPLALFGRQMWQNYQDMETLQVGLKAVTGSTAEMRRQWAMVEEIAKLPGVGIREAAQGLVSLQAAGLSLKDATDAIKGFGNAVAVAGGGAFELERVMLALRQIANTPTLRGQDVNLQLVQHIPNLARAMREIWGTQNTEELNKMGVKPLEFIQKMNEWLLKQPQVGNTAKNMMENLADSVRKLGLAAGEVAAPYMEKLVNATIRATEAFRALSPTMRGAIVAGAALLAILGPLALMLSKLPAIIAGVTLAIKGLSAAITLVTAHPVVAALAALAVTVGLIAKTFWDATKGAEALAKQEWEAARARASEAGYVDIEAMYRAKLKKRKPGWDVEAMEQADVIEALSAEDRKAVWQEYKAAIRARKTKASSTGVKMGIEGETPEIAEKPAKSVDEWTQLYKNALRAEKEAARELEAYAATKALSGWAREEAIAQQQLKKRLLELEAEKKNHLPVAQRIKEAYAQFQERMREIKEARKRQLQEWEDAETEARESARYIRLGIGKEGADLMELEARQALERSKRELARLAKTGEPVTERRALAQAQYDAAMAAAQAVREREAKEAEVKAREAAWSRADAIVREAQAYGELVKVQGDGLSAQLAASEKLLRAEEDRLVLLQNQLEAARLAGDETQAASLQADIYERMASMRNIQNAKVGLVVGAFRTRTEAADAWMNYQREWGGGATYREAAAAAVTAHADMVNALSWARGQVSAGSEQWNEYSEAILRSVESMQAIKRAVDDMATSELDASIGAMKAFRDMNRAAGVDTRQTSAQIIRMERDKLDLLQRQLAVAEALGQVETAENLRRSIFELRREIMQTAQAQTRWISITDIWRQSMERAATSRVRLSPAFATGQSGQVVVQDNPALVGAINQLSGVIREWAGNYLG